jgi:hypothetical protein
LCDESATIKVRLATAEEAAFYRQTKSTEPPSNTNVVYLVDLDG